MKNFFVTSFGLLLAIMVASPDCWAQVKFDGSGPGDPAAFLNGDNWTPAGVPNDPDPATSGDPRYAINDGFVVTYDTSATTLVEGLIVGGDAPQGPGDLGTPGTLNMSDGMLIVTGGGDAFEIARACCNDLPGDVSAVNLTGDAVLEIRGSDPIVGDRDRGELNIGPGTTVNSVRDGGVYWRVGNYGPSIDTGTIPGGLQGEGLLNVEGSFRAHVIFIGANDGDGEVRVSGNGSVILTDNLVPSINTDLPNRSALVHVIGSSATLEALNLESANGLSQVHNQYLFEADAGGVSEIKLTDAVNITNNDLTVNLTGFSVLPQQKILLFDAAPDRVFGAFANLTILGANPIDYMLVYDQPNGDILLMNRVPEPSTVLLLVLGMVMAISAKRRASR